MIQLVILVLALLCLIFALTTLARGMVSLTKGSQLTGPAARNAGLGLLALAVLMTVFALFVLPAL